MQRFISFVVLSAIFSVLLSRYGTSLGLGKMPGDFTMQGDGRIWHIPLGTCIIASIVLTIVWNLLQKLRR